MTVEEAMADHVSKSMAWSALELKCLRALYEMYEFQQVNRNARRHMPRNIVSFDPANPFKPKRSDTIKGICQKCGEQITGKSGLCWKHYAESRGYNPERYRQAMMKARPRAETFK